MVARAQKEAARTAERGDLVATREWLAVARGAAAAVPSSTEIMAEMAALDDLEAALGTGQNQLFVKYSKARSYGRKQSRSAMPPRPPGASPGTGGGPSNQGP